MIGSPPSRWAIRSLPDGLGMSVPCRRNLCPPQTSSSLVGLTGDVPWWASTVIGHGLNRPFVCTASQKGLEGGRPRPLLSRVDRHTPRRKHRHHRTITRSPRLCRREHDSKGEYVRTDNSIPQSGSCGAPGERIEPAQWRARPTYDPPRLRQSRLEDQDAVTSSKGDVRGRIHKRFFG
jgi:hypothetical protein